MSDNYGINIDTGFNKIELITMTKEAKDANHYHKLPYRRGIGIMLINQDKKIFIAKRVDTKGEAWQMPQGGMDLGETPSRAALREMKEELGCDNAKIIAESKYWYSYKFPEFLVTKLWGGKFQGQQQKWFLMQFLGKDTDININTENPEFYEWRWVDINQLNKIIIPFKKKLYKAIINEFQYFF